MLSRYGGLTIIDTSNPAQLVPLGRYPTRGNGREMYLRDGVVYATFSSFGQWLCEADQDSCKLVVSSHIAALDVSDPANIVEIGSFDLPGALSDTRLTGDVLYAALDPRVRIR